MAPKRTKTHTKPLRAKTPSKRSRGKAAGKQPKSSREKVRAYRKRLRAKGLRPITVWIPDTRSSEFTAEARRQCLLANRSPYAADDQAWVDSLSEWKID